MDQLLADLRLGLRSISRSPGHALVTILVLGFGVGVGAAALAVAQRALLEPLPYERAHRLVLLFEAAPGGSLRLASYPTAQDWEAQADVFESISYVTGSQLLLRLPAGPELVLTAYPSGSFFSLIAARPLLGRGFSPSDPAGEQAVVLSHTLWRRRFGGRADIVGQRIPLGDGGATVIGVMPPGFQFPEWAEAWMPLEAAPPSIQGMLVLRGNHADSRVIARLKDGVTKEQAKSEMDVIARRLAQTYPEDSREWTAVSFVSMAEYSMRISGGGVGQSLTPRIGLVIGAAVLILLLGCANVASLGLVRGFSRSRELAVRAAVGASRGRIVRHLMTESLTLAAIGGAVGLAIGYALVRVAQLWNPDLFPRLAEIELDGTFIAVAAGLALIVAVASGLAPALRATPRSLTTVLGGGRGAVGEGRAPRRLQAGLIAGQVAVATMLMVGAGLLLKSLKRVIDTPVGFNLDHLSVIGVTPSSGEYETPERTLSLYRTLLEAVRQVPGVESVAFVNHPPLGGASMPTRVIADGRDAPPDQPDLANLKTISPNYFTTVEIPVLRGRTFTDADLTGPNEGLVINQELADQLWPSQDPIGKRLTIFKSARWLPDFGKPIHGTVIGVIGDVRQFGPETEPPGEVYVPYTWNLWQWGNLVIRSSRAPNLIREPVRRAMLAVEPDLPVGGTLGFSSFEERLVGLRAPRRLLTLSLAALAGAALGITVVGLYAILAYSVSRRRAELGIRFALGATRRHVLGQVLREGLGVTLLGLVIGIVGAWAGARLLTSLVFGVSPRDLGVFAVVPFALVLVAVVAAYLPAQRAALVDPLEALRE
jgi:predicted permease